MVAPDAFMVDVDALLALGVCRHHRAISLDDCMLEEVGGLLLPDPEPYDIDKIHEDPDVGHREAAAEVTCRSGIRDPRGTQSIEIDFVVTAKLEVFNAFTAGKDVECDVQNVVGLMIRHVPFEHMQRAVDLADQVYILCQQEHGADPAGAETTDAIGGLVVNVRRRHHGSGPLRLRHISESLGDSSCIFQESLLACRTFFSDSSAHSKASLFGIVRMCCYLHYSNIIEAFRVLFQNSQCSSNISRLFRG